MSSVFVSQSLKIAIICFVIATSPRGFLEAGTEPHIYWVRHDTTIYNGGSPVLSA